ncbi:hypothetical protein V6Z88_004311 [Aspergillus fumigatus]
MSASHDSHPQFNVSQELGLSDGEKQEAPDGTAAHSPASQSRACHGEERQKEEGADGAADGRTDGKVELKENDCYDKLGFSYPSWKKWTILTVVVMVQISMNFNASFYASGITPIAKHFHIAKQAARVGQMDFLIAYGFGSEFWAPWSEEYGRWPVMQLSLFFVNIWQIPCALAPNFGTIVVCRALGGLSSAGGSVTLGMVADMWEPDRQQYAVAYIVFASVAGSVVAPIVGGFVTTFLSWHWNFWLQLILGGFVQAVHFFVPETRCSILVTREARKRRKQGEEVYSGDELKGKRVDLKYFATLWARPFVMFVREPIVLWLSLLSGFSDALIFTFLQSYEPVYKQWNFNTITIGLAFIPIMIGYFLAWFSFLPWIHRHCRVLERDPDALQPEVRLYWLLWGRSLLYSSLACQTYYSNSCSALDDWSFWLRMDQSRSAAQRPLDCADDIFHLHCDSELFHLHGHNRLHDCLLRAIFRLSNRRQCPSTRLPGRHRSHVFRSNVQIHEQITPPGMAFHPPRFPIHHFHHPNLHLLLERP